MQVWSLPAAQTLYSNLQLQSSRATLELGVGHGASLPLLCALLPPSARYVATDVDPSVVATAEDRAAALGLSSRVEFAVADAARLGEDAQHADGSYDRIAANFLLHLLPDPAAALAEAHRVLAPGGIAAFSLWGAKKDSLMYTLQGKVLRKLGAEAQPTHPNFRLGADEAALRGLFAAAGFRRVVLWHQPSVLPALDGGSFVRERLEEGDAAHVALVERSLATVLEDVDLTVPQFKKALRAAAEGVLARGGPLALDTIIVIATK